MMDFNNSPALSIIIPMYNSEETIEEVIHSVQKQTLKDLEIICIDDGSDDSSYEIVNRLLCSDKRIRLFTQKNIGAGATRNKGIQLAKGEYVIFLDADDYYIDVTALEEMVKQSNLNNVNICGSYRKTLSDGKIRCVDLYEGAAIPAEGRMMEFSEFQQDYHYHGFLFRRKFLLENNIVFPEYIWYEDPVFFLKAMVIAKVFYVVPRYLYMYKYVTGKVHWDQKKVVDCLRGIYRNLSICIDNNYDRLLYRIVNRLNVDYYHRIKDNMCLQTKELLLKIEKMIEVNNINVSIKISTEINPLVSVILPIYNKEKYLKKCLDTIINQTMHDIEIICINDKSTDNTSTILKEYSNFDNRIIIINNEVNIGAALSRNKGIDIARGEYLFILDADDYFEDNYFKTMYETCINNNAEVGVCDSYWGTNIHAKVFADCESVNILPSKLKCFAPSDYPDILFRLFLEVPWNKIYNRKFIKKYNIKFQNITNSNDVFFSQIVLALSNKISYINKPFVHYRYSTGNQISTNRNKMPYEIAKALQHLYDRLRKENVYETYKKAFMQYAVHAVNNRYKFAHRDCKEEFGNFMLNSGLRSIGMIEGIDYVCSGKANEPLIKLLNRNSRESFVSMSIGNFDVIISEGAEFNLIRDTFKALAKANS